LHPAANPLGSLTPAEAPLITAEILFRQPGPALLRPEEIEANCYIDESLCGQSAPKYIGIVDDMLTAGAHFRAANNILSKRFPTSRITGLFIARRIFSNSGEVSLDDLLA
ncbi:hypothetical protein ABIA99_002206, partial [Bradyrhizobium sp. LB12.1]|uniref:hypothetical protein n=1 Tax=Bradyrhizobium sp. LB12.1 TaxID=3156327 RepID=UPI003395E036